MGKQDDVTSTPNEDLSDRVDQVLRDFADMKDDFRQTIDELGTHVEAVMEGHLAEAYIAMGQIQARDSKKSKKQLEREQREAERARRDSERVKQRLAAKTKIAKEKKSADTVTADADVADDGHDDSDQQSNNSEK